ncbi:MAG: ABC transporter ATP-binding protein [Acidobacteriota bacterium]
MSTALVVAEGLSKSFGTEAGTEVSVLTGVDLSLSPGEAVALVGVSGSGKSTLLQVLGGMLRPDAGRLRVGDVEPWELTAARRADWRGAEIGFVFQAHRLIPDLNAVENVLVPAWIAGRDAHDEADELLRRLGLAERRDHRPSALSGGEAQRVAVARALIRRPRVILADEPTGNLDRAVGASVFEALRELANEAGTAVLMATHDRELAAACDRVLHLDMGHLAPS